MKKVLGLDLGTTSIGWALINEAENKNEESAIIKLGVRVNPLSTDEQQDFEKGKSITTNANRTLKRHARRNLDRFKLRRKVLIENLIKANIINNQTLLSEDGKDSTFTSYEIRAKSTFEKISLEEFARVLLMINKKRGYKSSRKTDAQEDGEAIDAMGIAKLINKEKITPGEYIYSLLKNGAKVLPDFYRSDLEAEFLAIWDFQKQFHPNILTNELLASLEGKNKIEFEKEFKKAGIEKAETPKGKAPERKLTEYEWRAKTVIEEIDLRELVYVLSKIHTEINSASGYLAAISDRSKELYFNNLTVGQYLYSKLNKNLHNPLKNQVFYRKDYEDEFEVIWNKQAEFYPLLNDDLKKKIKDITIFYQRPLKSQKGLLSFCEFESKQIEKIVNGEPKMQTIGMRVIPKSSPLFQEFKIWQIIENLKVNGKKDVLEDDQKKTLFHELNFTGELTAKELAELLYENPKDVKLNYEKIEGNRTSLALIEAYNKIYEIEKGEKLNFKKLDADTLQKEFHTFFDEMGYNADLLYFDSSVEGKELFQQAQYQLWHLLYSYEGDNSKTGNQSLINKITEKFGFPEQYAKIIAAVKFQDDYGNLSAKAVRKLLPFLAEGNDYTNACICAGYEKHSKASLNRDEIANKILKDRLKILNKNSLRNPVVEKILNQMINVINAVCNEYGKPDEIRIEMARELKQSAKEREETTKAINKATADYEKYRKIIKEEFGLQRVSKNDLIRYRLYLELESNGYKGLYSNEYIPKEKLFSKEVDIEHIIPQARLFDDSFSNKTLEYRKYNLEKSNETAYDYMVNKGNNELDQYEARVKSMKNMSPAKRKKLLISSDNIPDGFINRDLRDSQYIAKKAKQLLEEVFRNVTTTTGSVTNVLRKDWGLENVMQELNWDKYKTLGLVEYFEDKDGKTIGRIKDWTKRNDHRHHAMDALTVAFTRHNHIQFLNYKNARRDETHKQSTVIHAIENKETYRDQKKKLRFNPPIPLDNFRAEAKAQLEAVLVSQKAKNKVTTKNINKIKQKNGVLKVKAETPRGQLHKETIYGSSKQYVSKEEKVNASFDQAKINTIAKLKYKNALLERLSAFDNDPKKAFTGTNSLAKNPIYLNEMQTHKVPEKVKTVEMETIFTIRKDIAPDLKIDKVVDVKVRQILQDRFNEFDGDAKKAFVNLEENPIWLNKEKGIAIKSVTITGVSNAIALHFKKDKEGKDILDQNANKIPVDFVSTGNNHHVAIYRDEKGNLQEEVVSFFEAVERRNQGLSVIKKEHEQGWELLFTMKQNEFFVFPNEVDDFNPVEADLLDKKNYSKISPNLFRVQKFGSLLSGFWFRHHLETSVQVNSKLKNITYKVVQSTKNLEGLYKVRLNHLGKIVHVGEY